VRVTHAFDNQNLFRVTRRRKRAIGEHERGIRQEVRAHGPACFAGRRLSRNDLSAEGNERARETVCAEDVERLIRGIALGDAAQVEPHPGPGQTYRTMHSVDVDCLPIDEPRGAREFERIRVRSRATGVSPERTERADRRVERTARLAGKTMCTLHHGEKLVAYDKRFGAGKECKLRDLAVGPEVAEHTVELSDAMERLARRGRGHGFLLRVKQNADFRAHANRSILEPLERRPGRACQNESQPHHTNA
jgi:hypothetical protein